ncbi:glycoside hydrolase family 75 protein, partial [Streptomyces sp. NPDC005486]|uniref:glycoside hydrolase family 75 protein n=1 Tax=Streptomyces sp. NPDC005486 TaxID=3155345 RepID=UPI0033BE36B8
LPYIVVPGVSSIWDHRDHGVGGGSVAAVVYQDRVQYAVVGDTGPREIIGEASYATAKALGIRPDPRGGGTPSGVTYIVFRNSRATPIESHVSAVEVGERLARLFVRGVAKESRLPEAPVDEWAPTGLSESPQGEGGARGQTGAGGSGGAAVGEPEHREDTAAPLSDEGHESGGLPLRGGREVDADGTRAERPRPHGPNRR